MVRPQTPLFARAALALAVLLLAAGTSAHAATSLTQHGITWTFADDHETGTFANGDYWVKGPVTIISITNNMHAEGFTPKPGQNGSMVNPGGGGRQGYDSGVRGTYDEALNAALPNGKPLSRENPLVLKPGQSLVSSVSWLYRSADDREPGCPRMSGTIGSPRPALRSGAVLTCLDAAPPEGSFRPPYCGDDKKVKFNRSGLKVELLKKLAPVPGTPEVARVEKIFERPWIDHVHQWTGEMLRPSMNMPNYGRDMTHAMNQVALMLHLDFDALPGKPSKDVMLVRFVQYGIDLAGIADVGGGWPANGGHHMGRKWPILFAGLLLDDAHMKNVGQWKTRFQEDEQTFYVTQEDVERTNSPAWKPDARADKLPYHKGHIGMPEWGIVHTANPLADNRSLGATYRGINAMVYPGFVLAAHLMNQKEAWNHNALFDYVDRWMGLLEKGETKVGPPTFVQNMWNAYRKPAAPAAADQ